MLVENTNILLLFTYSLQLHLNRLHFTDFKCSTILENRNKIACLNEIEHCMLRQSLYNVECRILHVLYVIFLYF